MLSSIPQKIQNNKKNTQKMEKALKNALCI